MTVYGTSGPADKRKSLILTCFCVHWTAGFKKKYAENFVGGDDVINSPIIYASTCIGDGEICSDCELFC